MPIAWLCPAPTTATATANAKTSTMGVVNRVSAMLVLQEAIVWNATPNTIATNTALVILRRQKRQFANVSVVFRAWTVAWPRVP